jgi:hypothetical protein
MELAKELEATLREFAAVEPVEVRENGRRVAPLAGLPWEVRGAAEKPLLHLWSSEYNLTRRVLAITAGLNLCAYAARALSRAAGALVGSDRSRGHHAR